MRFGLVVALLCALPLTQSLAQEEVLSDPDAVEAGVPEVTAAPASTPAPVAYSRESRFEHPFDATVQDKAAEDVVLNEISYDALPAFVRADVQGNLLGACAAGTIGTAGIKAYSSVSALIRVHGLSSNYLVDFTGLATADPQENCAAAQACGEDGCLLAPYTSYGYEMWQGNTPLRTLGWTLGQVDDLRASAIPQLNRPERLSVFDVREKCPADKAAGADGDCHAMRLWLIGGLSVYTPPVKP